MSSDNLKDSKKIPRPNEFVSIQKMKENSSLKKSQPLTRSNSVKSYKKD